MEPPDVQAEGCEHSEEPFHMAGGPKTSILEKGGMDLKGQGQK